MCMQIPTSTTQSHVERIKITRDPATAQISSVVLHVPHRAPLRVYDKAATQAIAAYIDAHALPLPVPDALSPDGID
jgi:hypothetical protein